MLARRRRRAAARPRVDRAAPLQTPTPATPRRPEPAPVKDRPPGTVSLTIVWRKPCVRPPVVAANYDAWMHHRLAPAPAPSARDLDHYAVTLFVPMGVQVTYKFLVDGKWRVDDAPDARHELSSDGKVHIVPPLFRDTSEDSLHVRDVLSGQALTRKSSNSFHHSALPQTSSASVLPSRHAPPAYVRGPGNDESTPASSPMRKLFTRGESFSGPFLSEEPPAETYSLSKNRCDAMSSAQVSGDHAAHSRGYGAAARRSVLMRVGGARWRTRLGMVNGVDHSVDATESEPSGTPPSKQRGGSRYRAPSVRPGHTDTNSDSVCKSLTSSGLADEPAVVTSAAFFSGTNSQDTSHDTTSGVGDKENGSYHVKPKVEHTWKGRDSLKLRQSPGGGKRHRRSAFPSPGKLAPLSAGQTPQSQPNSIGAVGVRGTTRSSSRGLQKVTVSGPSRVDEPEDHDHVHRTAQNWRAMAQHLQEDLNDPVGARQLLHKAIEHREKHGLWSTFENAQVHIDLARSLSKATLLSDTEFHLRIALRIYEQVGAAPEHKGDLVHYIAVVVDRQKKRTEAELMYKQALDIYKAEGLSGDNVNIALKNLALNLKKQDRTSEADVYIQEYRGETPTPALNQPLLTT